MCKNKKEGELFIQTRHERETMLSVLIDTKSSVPSYVIKLFGEKKDAEAYVLELRMADILINKTIK